MNELRKEGNHLARFSVTSLVLFSFVLLLVVVVFFYWFALFCVMYTVLDGN